MSSIAIPVDPLSPNSQVGMFMSYRAPRSHAASLTSALSLPSGQEDDLHPNLRSVLDTNLHFTSIHVHACKYVRAYLSKCAVLGLISTRDLLIPEDAAFNPEVPVPKPLLVIGEEEAHLTRWNSSAVFHRQCKIRPATRILDGDLDVPFLGGVPGRGVVSARGLFWGKG